MNKGEAMIGETRQSVPSYSLLKAIKDQTLENKVNYPRQFLEDRWRIDNSPIADYEQDFSSVTTEVGGMGIVDFIKSRSFPIVLDLMASSDTLVSLFTLIKEKPKFGLAVSLHDKRDDAKKRRDTELGIKQLGGDILRASTWVIIQNELEGRKADLIMARAVGGLGFLPANKNVCAALMKRAWNSLSKQGGMLLIQTMHLFDPEVECFRFDFEDAAPIIKNWVDYLTAKNIRAAYNHMGYSESIGNFGALKLIKSPDSPTDLPLPSLDVLNKSNSLSQKVRQLDQSEKDSIDAILKWCEINS